MDPEKLLETITDPEAWRTKSIALRRSVDLIWDAFIRSFIEYGRTVKETGAGDKGKLDEALEHLIVAKMLYGLALETAFKGPLAPREPKRDPSASHG